MEAKIHISWKLLVVSLKLLVVSWKLGVASYELVFGYSVPILQSFGPDILKS